MLCSWISRAFLLSLATLALLSVINNGSVEASFIGPDNPQGFMAKLDQFKRTVKKSFLDGVKLAVGDRSILPDEEDQEKPSGDMKLKSLKDSILSRPSSPRHRRSRTLAFAPKVVVDPIEQYRKVHGIYPKNLSSKDADEVSREAVQIYKVFDHTVRKAWNEMLKVQHHLVDNWDVIVVGNLMQGTPMSSWTSDDLENFKYGKEKFLTQACETVAYNMIPVVIYYRDLVSALDALVLADSAEFGDLMYEKVVHKESSSESLAEDPHEFDDVEVQLSLNMESSKKKLHAVLELEPRVQVLAAPYSRMECLSNAVKFFEEHSDWEKSVADNMRRRRWVDDDFYVEHESAS